MNAPLTLSDKKFIEKQSALGVPSSKIAEALGISIWTVYKWQSLLKKRSNSQSKRASKARGIKQLPKITTRLNM